MLSKKEIKLIKLIKYTPIFIVGIICLIITILLSIEKNVSLNKELETLRKDYLERNREVIKNEVDKVYDYISHQKSISEDELKHNLKIRVYEAYNLVNYIYEKYKNKESKEQIITRIKDSLKAIRFNDNRGYYYIDSLDGINIFHPIRPELENHSILNIKDEFGNSILGEVIDNAKKSKESYTTYYWAKPEDLKNKYKKITFNKVFEPYNFIIGTGEYLNDFENIEKKEILSYISTIRYDKNGYVFVIDEKGVYLSHIEKSYIGLNRIDLKDQNGFMITKEILNLALNEKGGYLKYVGTIKPETKLPAEKITYVRGFKDWNWTIATGFYTDELEKQISEKELEIKDKYANKLGNLLLISLGLTGIFLVISFYISRKLEKRFYKYKQQVLNHIKQDREKDTILAQQAKMAAMGEMLENIAHQWRQPLSSISTISTGIKIQYEYAEVNKEDVIKSMSTIATTTKYLSQTIDDFRDYFNPQKEPAFFNLKTIFEKVSDLLEPQLHLKNIQIIKDIDDVYIFGMENEFLQVIINLLNNSKDEFETKEFEKKYIFIDTKVTEDEISVILKDNAGGIDEKIIDKVFESYFTTKQKSKGTGIGLYMSKQIVEKHMKGSILVSNESYTYKEKSYTGAKFLITFVQKKREKII
ncbi:MAG: cache domain-containing protein [Aliarcobacter sp.]|nr:cache domain-containing protein [Aliarcobacter sp.]